MSKLTQLQSETLQKFQAKLLGKSPEKQLNLIYNWIKQGLLSKPMYLKYLIMSIGMKEFIENELKEQRDQLS
jgi:hypothetical protein